MMPSYPFAKNNGWYVRHYNTANFFLLFHMKRSLLTARNNFLSVQSNICGVNVKATYAMKEHYVLSSCTLIQFRIAYASPTFQKKSSWYIKCYHCILLSIILNNQICIMKHYIILFLQKLCDKRYKVFTV